MLCCIYMSLCSAYLPVSFSSLLFTCFPELLLACLSALITQTTVAWHPPIFWLIPETPACVLWFSNENPLFGSSSYWYCPLCWYLHLASPSVLCSTPPCPLPLTQALPTDRDTPPSPAEGDMPSSGRSAQCIVLCSHMRCISLCFLVKGDISGIFIVLYNIL